MEAFGNRYLLKESWKKADNGWIARAADEKLKRDVLLYRMKAEQELQRKELVRRLSQAARFSDKGFLPVLDVGVEGDELYAVLAGDSGGLLADGLTELRWSGTVILEKLGELAGFIREGRRERLADFSVTTGNIWMDRDGRLRFLNSWAEAKADERDVRGLAGLLYKLCTKTDSDPPSMADYCEALRTALKGLPGGPPEAAVSWACRAFHPSCTLREFEQGLNRLLGKGGAAEVKATPAPKPRMQAVPVVPPPPPPTRYERESSQPTVKWGWVLPWLLVAGFAAGVAAIWVWSYDRFESSIIPPKAAEASTAASPKSEPSTPAATKQAGIATAPAGSPKAQPSPTPTPSPSASPAVAASPSPSVSPSTAPEEPAAAGIVPDLVGRSREEAEKLALRAGLRYSFTLEVSPSAKGMVIRQNLKPGDPVKKGDRIQFVVSKGE